LIGAIGAFAHFMSEGSWRRRICTTPVQGAIAHRRVESDRPYMVASRLRKLGRGGEEVSRNRVDGQ
jgi:hypothetical protein